MICITVVAYFGDYQYQLGESCVIYVGEHTNITNIKGLWEGYVNKEFRLQVRIKQVKHVHFIKLSFLNLLSICIQKYNNGFTA